MGKIPFRRRWLLAVVFLFFAIVALYVRHLTRDAPNLSPAEMSSEATPIPRPNSGDVVAMSELQNRLCHEPLVTICEKRNRFSDPTGTVSTDVVGEIQALRLYEKILHDNPGWTTDEVDEELVRLIYTPSRRKRIFKVEKWVKEQVVKLIDRQSGAGLSDEEKSLLKKRVTDTVLELPPPASLYSNDTDLFTKNTILYQTTSDGRKVIRVGGAYLFAVKSYYNLVFTFAHELAHVIDPCELKHEKIEIPAYDRLVQCFLNRGWVNSVNRKECGQNDQTQEVFADWVASFVVGEALKSRGADYSPEEKGFSVINSVRDLCDQDDGIYELDFANHPPPKVRIEKIYAQNPEIRKILGCDAATKRNFYCQFEGKP